MALRRFFRKRRNVINYVLFFGLSFIIFSLWNSVVNIENSMSFKGPYQPRFGLEFAQSGSNRKNGVNFAQNGRSRENASYPSPTNGPVCFEQYHFQLHKHAYIYTYDLPEETDYTLITGKRFKEYTIPVKSEKVAYGPDLDPVTVLLIPFSHVDPGYGNTMEGYYLSQTKNTLNNMVKKLEQYQNLTFQWAETVFLERWWRDITPDVKELTRKLVKNGQLEIVLGGWVMPDEASTHYVSVIDQLIEGHQWLVENLETKPINSWSNDPFGFSSTMPYLWKKTGIDNMVILRIHQAIKGTLMKKHAMEFMWKQLWSEREENDIFCHLMAYRGYWIGDTCGPYNQHICREYAFMHTEPIHKVIFVTKDNLEERARILYEQYRITSEVYRRHGLEGKKPGVRLFLPMFLGEDFSYTKARDFDLIHSNYKMLFDYINNKKEWKMDVKFGTLKEYFDLVKDYQNTRSGIDGSKFPSLAGDFFPYSDYQNDYWTGYYTTRPFNKQMSRELQYLVRLADIFHTYAYAYSKHRGIEYKSFAKVSKALRDARRELGMFQHHDGMTGTSVLHVINDFKTRLFTSLTNSKFAIKEIATQLLTSGESTSADSFHDVSKRMGNQDMNKLIMLPDNSKGKIVIMNPSSKSRTDVVEFLTRTPVKVVKTSGDEIEFQLYMAEKGCLVSFTVEALPFSIQTYTFEAVTEGELDEKKFGEEIGVGEVKSIPIENDCMRAEFDKTTGMLVSITELHGNKKKIAVEMDILAYKSKRSGAYIFAPAGPASPFLSGQPDIKVNHGPLRSTIYVTYKGFAFTASLYNTKSTQSHGLHITTVIDMKSINSYRDKEVILRFKTDIDNGNKFFTDQNAFQMMGRKTFPDRTIEENYYPITTMMMIQDTSRRLTLHSAQPHGGACLESGWMEVMLDRCVTRDDDKGLGQGVSDNVPTEARFILQYEKLTQEMTTLENRYTFPSTRAILMNDLIENPIYLQYLVLPNTNVWEKDFKPIKHSLPCTLEVISLRTLVTNDLSYNSTGLVLHKKSAVCYKDDMPFHCDQGEGHATLATLFPDFTIKTARETSLSHLHVLGKILSSDELTPRAMELRSFTVDF